MSDPDVTVIKEKGSGGGVIVAIIALVIVAAVAFWLISTKSDAPPSDANVAAAADKVGAAAEQVGNAAEDAVSKIDQ